MENQTLEYLLHSISGLLNFVGGDFNPEKLKNKSFSDICNVCLQNGIKITFELDKNKTTKSF